MRYTQACFVLLLSLFHALIVRGQDFSVPTDWRVRCCIGLTDYLTSDVEGIIAETQFYTFASRAHFNRAGCGELSRFGYRRDKWHCPPYVSIRVTKRTTDVSLCCSFEYVAVCEPVGKHRTARLRFGIAESSRTCEEQHSRFPERASELLRLSVRILQRCVHIDPLTMLQDSCH